MTHLLLIIVGIIVSTSVCNAAESPSQKLVKSHNLRPRVIPGSWTIGSATKLTTHFTKCKPQPRPLMPTKPSTIKPCVLSDDCPSNKVLMRGFSYNSTKRKAPDKKTLPRPKRVRRNKNSMPILPMSPTVPDIPTLTVPDETSLASPSSPLTSDLDASATPSSPSSDTSSETSLPSSPFKFGREEVMSSFTEHVTNTPVIDEATQVLIKQAIIKERQTIEQALIHSITQDVAKQRVKKPKHIKKMDKFARDIKKFFDELNSNESLHSPSMLETYEEHSPLGISAIQKKHAVKLESLAADIQAFEEENGNL